MQITYYPIPTLCHPQQHPKNQIYIHHTISNGNPYNVANWWVQQQKNTGYKIATAFIIAGSPDSHIDATFKDGEIIQLFTEENWAAHLGKPTQTPGTQPLTAAQLHRQSIAIELCNWGYVRRLPAGNYITGGGTILKQDKVIELNYRNQQHFHRYTPAQIESLRQLLLNLTQKYNIPRTYNPIFGICPEALHGKPGIFSHTSVRIDKTDISPQPQIIQMLKTLS